MRLNPEVLFVDDGDVLTSAGVGAGVDLCLHLVRRDFGSEVANWSARRSVMPPWRDGGAGPVHRPHASVCGSVIDRAGPGVGGGARSRNRSTSRRWRGWPR